jgi:hypothetical protein
MPGISKNFCSKCDIFWGTKIFLLILSTRKTSAIFEHFGEKCAKIPWGGFPDGVNVGEKTLLI